MEPEPFTLRVRTPRVFVLALLGAVWLAIGVASAAYVAQTPNVAEIAD